MSKPIPAGRRRWWKALGVVLVIAILLLAALPWLISIGPLRARVALGLNRGLAPGRIQFEGLHVSWFGPTRLDRVAIHDPKGEAVIKAATLTLDLTLGQLILRDRKPAVLTLDGASLEVARSEEGSINLVDALRTVIVSPEPDRDLTIRIVDGSIRYRDPFLAEPAVADTIDLTIHAHYAPGPVTWKVKFGHGDASLESQGDFDAWLAKGGPPRKPELQIGVVGKRWPFVARTAGVDAVGRLDGSLDFVRKRGLWVFSGDARLDGLNAKGKDFPGDTLVLDKFEAGWDLAEGEEGWKIRRLSVASPLGRLKAEGQLNGPGGAGQQRIEGTVDLAEVARQLPHALHLRDGLAVGRGSARLAVDLNSNLGQTTCDVEAKVSDLAARDHDRELSLKEPATLNARLIRKGDDNRVERLSIHTAFLDVSAKGGVEEGVAYSGTIDLGGLRKQLGEWVDLGGLDLAGGCELEGVYQSRPTSSPRVYKNNLTAKLKDLRIEASRLGPIRRDSASLGIITDGPSGSSGLPEGWRELVILGNSGKSEGRIHLQSKGGTTLINASASTPVTLGTRARSATISLDGRWKADRRILAFDQALAVLDLSDQRTNRSRFGLAASGRLDVARGELILEPSREAKADFLAIDPEGLRISGLGQGLESLRFEGGISGDLAGLDPLLAEMTGRSPLGLSGHWSAVGNARGEGDGVTLAGRFGIDSPLSPVERQARPTGLALRAHYSPSSDRLDLSEFTVSSPYGTLDASGKLDGATGDKVIDLRGILSPDFGAITAQLASRIEPGARVDGRPRAFRATGPLGGDGSKGWKGLEAEFGFDLSGADIYGMKFGPSPVVLRASRGRLVFDPVSTSLNEGHVRLEPEVDLDAPGGPILRLAKNSNIREARINDEVSKRVLAYVAPILDQATRASGLVSVDLDHAEFPIGPGRGRQAKVEGAVVFQDVEFAPGPLAGEILGVIGRRDLSLKLDQPVTLTIADGRVNQRGMTIPIGELTRIELNGWVDFDRNIALNASLPVTPAMLGNNPLLSEIVAGTRVRLPISGTLDHPAIDQGAFTANIQELGKSLLTRGATRGVMELLKGITRPRDPDSPPPPPRPSPEERKAMRQEKKAIRRGEIPPPAASPRP